MTMYKLRAGLRGLAALLLAAAAAGAAHGAVYQGSWDPAYGDPFGDPELGWRGKAAFDVADSCSASNPVSSSANVTDCVAKVTYALVEFYLVTDVGTPTKAKIEYTTVMQIDDLKFTDSSLTGIDTGLFSYMSLAFVNGGTKEALFGNEKLAAFALDFNINDPYNGPRLCWTRAAHPADVKDCNTFNSTAYGFVPTLKIERLDAVLDVPEPSSLALVFGGLLAAAGVGHLRRRRN